MTSFPGVIRLADEPDATIQADMDIFDDRLVLSTAGAEIGSWPLTSLQIEPTSGGFSLVADGESIILQPSDPGAFAGAVGLDTNNIVMPEPAPAIAEPVDPNWVKEQAKTLGPLRQRSAAEWAERDRIPGPVRLILGAAIALTVLGVLLGWGAGDLIDGLGFPLGRALFALIAITLIGGLYMASNQLTERHVVGLTSIGAGVLGLLVLWLWGRTTGVAFGYLVASIAATVAIIGGALAAAEWKWVVFPARHEAHQPPKSASRSRLGRVRSLFSRR